MEYTFYIFYMQEAELYDNWKYYAFTGQSIQWGDNILKVIDSGVLNEHNGPDFQFARFMLNNTIYQGAVEFHIHIDDWYKHKHHFDPSYRDVVLHIVAEKPEKQHYVKHNLTERLIPTFFLKKTQFKSNKITCIPGSFVKPDQIRDQLQILALDRLNLKIQSFNKMLKSTSEHSVFYQSFFRILGYPYNKNPFAMLALKIPAVIYEKYKYMPNLLLAIYFGCAGFLEGSFKDCFSVQLQKLFFKYSAVLTSSVLHQRQWHMSAIRPVNHPQFRLAAWISFLSSLNNQSPFWVIYHLLQERFDYEKVYKELSNLLSLKAKGYWKDHYALDKSLHNRKNNVYFGQLRIREFISNLIIPLCLSMANKNNDLGFVSYLLELYLWMPGNCTYGSLFRKKPWLKEYINFWQSCNTGQAFLHLDNVYCSRNQCQICPIGRVRKE